VPRTFQSAGGVSAPPYASLNLATHVGDASASVCENRQRLRTQLSLPAEPLWLEQVHGTQVLDADAPGAIGPADAAITSQAGRVLAVLEPRSNTMRLGGHADALAASLQQAEHVFVYARPDLRWDARQVLGPLGERLHLHAQLDALVADAAAEARPGDRLLVMSNGDFGGVHGKLLDALAARAR